MILIADSGSTKTDWCVVENGEFILRFKTRGMNPSESRGNREGDRSRPVTFSKRFRTFSYLFLRSRMCFPGEE